MSGIADHHARVRAVGCVLCAHMGLPKSPASIHHLESIRDGLSEWAVVPLCFDHHQGPNGVHGLSRSGFEARYKLTPIDLLAMTIKAII